MRSWKEPLQNRWNAFSRTPFGCLLRLFTGRMFHGGDESGAEELGLGVGAILTLLAMPGLLVSLLMFEKYGSLIRFLRGDGVFDPFTATIPDEYFFIVLSMTVTWSRSALAVGLSVSRTAAITPISFRCRSLSAQSFSRIFRRYSSSRRCSRWW